MKLQNCILINFAQTHGRKDKPKAICNFNFSKVRGIFSAIEVEDWIGRNKVNPHIAN